MKLTIELVPRTSWFNNLRSILPVATWDVLRKRCHINAHYACEICKGRGTHHPVEAHEIWAYDDAMHTQTLTGLIALCPRCHMVKHIGLAKSRGKLDEVRRHMSIVNGISVGEAQYEINEAFNLFNRRSQHKWEVDVTWATG